jgi:hypothetical protein
MNSKATPPSHNGKVANDGEGELKHTLGTLNEPALYLVVTEGFDLLCRVRSHVKYGYGVPNPLRD